MAWTYTEHTDLLPNIIVKGCYNDGELSHYSIYPATGYVIWYPLLSDPILDEEGNVIGEILYYTYGGGTLMKDYDFATNPSQIQAVLYEDGMVVSGGIPDEVI